MADGRLSGKVALVTGAGRGLGRAMALGLAAAGASVVAMARTEAEVASSAREAEAGGGRVVPLAADVTSQTDCRRAVSEALERFGALHLLVNNAGLGMRSVNAAFLTDPEPFWRAEATAWRALIDVNVNGPFLMAQAALPAMLANQWGRIVNVSMNYSTMGRKGFSPYGPSKAALESETAIWAQDLAGTGVTVNALLPGGATRTGMIPEGVPQEVRAQMLDPAVVVPPLLWLASEASDGVTGMRFNASLWRAGLGEAAAAILAAEPAGVGR
ncbi:MAG: SDR family oxidoreductase [Acidobacteriota bacterium]